MHKCAIQSILAFMVSQPDPITAPHPKEHPVTESTASRTGDHKALAELMTCPSDPTPEGEMETMSIQSTCGVSRNLFSCATTDDDTRTPFRLASVFRRNDAPDREGPSQRFACHGKRDHLIMDRSAQGRPVSLRAEHING